MKVALHRVEARPSMLGGSPFHAWQIDLRYDEVRAAGPAGANRGIHARSSYPSGTRISACVDRGFEREFKANRLQKSKSVDGERCYNTHMSDPKSVPQRRAISGCRPRAIRVLIAEDEQTSREFLASELEREGFLVCQAANGEEALEQVARFAPDVIVLDLMLPVVNGFAVARALHSLGRRRNVAILAVTALASEALRIEALAAGCDGFLRKPIPVTLVIEHLRLLVEGLPST